MSRVPVKPSLLRWARIRARFDVDDLLKRFPKLEEWELGEKKPTLKQLESFAKATRVSVGYLFLREPPVEQVPIPDLRTVGNQWVGNPSPDLLDTIYLCQHRQEWYRRHALSEGEGLRSFVGSVGTGDSVKKTAAAMRETLGFDSGTVAACRGWADALRAFVGLAESAGVLVMTSGIVGGNAHRRLDPKEFRGFSLADALAPLVFINGQDGKAAQMFTLAHELARIWLGQSAISNAGPEPEPSHDVEAWCNRVAAEFLVPADELRGALPAGDVLDHESRQAVARRFKVSTLVVLRSLLEAGFISKRDFGRACREEVARQPTGDSGKDGGDFCIAQPVRTSRRFARALIVSTLEGRTLYRDAFNLLGISSERMFHRLAKTLEESIRRPALLTQVSSSR